MAHSQDCTMKGIIIHVGILCGWTVTHPFNLFVGVGVGVGGRVALSDSLCTHILCLDICAYCSHKLCSSPLTCIHVCTGTKITQLRRGRSRALHEAIHTHSYCCSTSFLWLSRGFGMDRIINTDRSFVQPCMWVTIYEQWYHHSLFTSYLYLVHLMAYLQALAMPFVSLKVV